MGTLKKTGWAAIAEHLEEAAKEIGRAEDWLLRVPEEAPATVAEDLLTRVRATLGDVWRAMPAGNRTIEPHTLIGCGCPQCRWQRIRAPRGGKRLSLATRRKISKAHKGVKLSAAHRRRISAGIALGRLLK